MVFAIHRGRTPAWQTPGIAGPVNASPGRRPRSPFGNGFNFADALSLIGGGLKDLDGTMGSGNLDFAKAQMQDQRQQAERKRLIDLAAGGDQRALFLLDPSLALSERRDARNFEYEKSRDMMGDKRQSRLDDMTAEEHTARMRALTAPPDRKIVTGADGYQYYEDTKERVLPGVSRPAKEADPNDYRPVALGDGMYATFNPQTQQWDVGGGAFDAGTGMGGGYQPAEMPNPFRDLGVYGQKGGLIPIQFDGFQQVDGGFGYGQNQGVASPAGRKPTDFDKTQDREMAKDIADWKTSGQAAAVTNLERLQGVISALEGKNPDGTPLDQPKNLSGPVIGNAGSAVRATIFPSSLAAQQDAEAVVQGTLKAVLGGQFAQKEAEQLFARTYDPRLPEAENAKRLKLLYNDLVNRAMLNEAAARYADQYGTLQGFQGYLPGLQDFIASQASPTSGRDTQQSIPQGAIEALRSNPSLRDQFEQKYGAGSASSYLDGGTW